jgi:hypothetical protein
MKFRLRDPERDAGHAFALRPCTRLRINMETKGFHNSDHTSPRCTNGDSRQFAGSDRKLKFEENHRCSPREPPVHRPLHPLHGKHRQILQRRRLHVVQHTDPGQNKFSYPVTSHPQTHFHLTSQPEADFQIFTRTPARTRFFCDTYTTHRLSCKVLHGCL